MNRPQAAIIPSLDSMSVGLDRAIQEAGFDVLIVENLKSLGDVVPDVFVVNITGFGTPDTWAEQFPATIGEKMAGHFALIPTLVIDPPARMNWCIVGGYTSGVDAYTRWEEDANALAYILQQITARST